MLSPVAADAQTGWRWGVDGSSRSAEVDVWGTAFSKSGYVYTAGSASSDDTILSVITDTIFFGSTFITFPNDLFPLTITKTDSAGNFVWAFISQYSSPVCRSMVADDSGNLYVFAYYGDSICGLGAFTLHNPSLYTMFFLAKISPSGTVLWAKNVVPGNPGMFLGPVLSTSGIGIDEFSNVYIGAEFMLPSITIGTSTLINTNSTGTKTDIFLAKYYPSGNEIWARSFGGPLNDGLAGMTVTNAGTVYISWGSYSDTVTIGSSLIIAPIPSPGIRMNAITKFDSSGLPIWTKLTSRHMGVFSSVSDASDKLYLGGYTDSTFIFGADTFAAHIFFVTKLDSSGNINWVSHISTGYDDFLSVNVDRRGYVWACGPIAASTTYFDGHSLASPISLAGHDPMFIVEYCPDGYYLTSFGITSSGDDYTGIGVDTFGSVYIAGDFYNVPFMVFGVDTIYLSAIESEFVAKYKPVPLTCATLGTRPRVSEPGTATKITVYPNPVTGELTITSSDLINEVTICNLLGQTVSVQQCNSEKVQIDVSGLSPGIFLVRINHSEVREFVKQ